MPRSSRLFPGMQWCNWSLFAVWLTSRPVLRGEGRGGGEERGGDGERVRGEEGRERERAGPYTGGVRWVRTNPP